MIAVEIRDERLHGFAEPVHHAGRGGQIGEGAVTVVAVEDVAESFEVHGEPQTLVAARLRKVDVAADVQVRMAVAVEIAPGRAAVPDLRHAVGKGARRDIREALPLLIVQEHEAAEVGDEKVAEAVIVVVGDGDGHTLPGIQGAAVAPKRRERPIPLVSVEGVGGFFASGTVDEIEVPVAVVVEIEPGGARAVHADQVTVSELERLCEEQSGDLFVGGDAANLRADLAPAVALAVVQEVDPGPGKDVGESNGAGRVFGRGSLRGRGGHKTRQAAGQQRGPPRSPVRPTDSPRVRCARFVVHCNLPSKRSSAR